MDSFEPDNQATFRTIQKETTFLNINN